jgi:hypothetical protein
MRESLVLEYIGDARSMRPADSGSLWQPLGILILLASAIGCVVLVLCAQPVQPAAPAEGILPGDVPRNPPRLVSLFDRVQVALPGDRSVTLPPLLTGRQAGPDEVTLPTIDNQPLNQDQQQFLRMLAHAMAGAGLSCSMPRDLPRASWELLDAWTSPLRSERSELTKECKKLVSEAVNARLEAGRYEILDQPPAKWPPSDFVGWRHATDARGKSVVHFVRIGGGELPKVDFMRDRSSLIDRDMAALARSLFDRVSK